MPNSALINLNSTEARYVKMNIEANWGNSSFTALSEVQFEGTLAVPEPSFYGLIMGAAALGAVRFIRRRS